MAIFFIILLGTFFYCVPVPAEMFHKQLSDSFFWKEEEVAAFDELILSWNAERPLKGKFLFYIGAKIEEWSPWLLYAEWGSDGQSSFSSDPGAPIRIYQDAFEVTGEKKATAFRIKVMAQGDAILNGVYQLHVYTNGQEKKSFAACSLSPVFLKVAGLSQMTLRHSRNKELCSPTATVAVLRYLLPEKTIDPAAFADQVWDSGHDIFGNWVFNVAMSAAHLGRNWSCFVEKLAGFEALHRYLLLGYPVVVSVRGPLPGSASPYAKGHLMAAMSFDPKGNKVICMDPAFASNDQTIVSYDLMDFLAAWARRGNVAYIFVRSSHPFSE